MTHQWHDAFRHPHTPAHHLDPRTKLAAGLVYVGTVLFTPHIGARQLIALVLMLVTCAWMAQAPVPTLVRRLGAVLPFVALMALSLLAARLSAAQAGQVLTKSLLSVIAMTITTWATPFPDFLRALQQWRVPKLLILFLAFLYRYGAVMVKETQRVERGWTARYFGRRWGLQWMRLGHVLAALFLRSYERAERVYAAMLARGFSRDTSWIRVLHFGWPDVVFGAGAAATLAIIRWGLA